MMILKFKGGYNLSMAGYPSLDILSMPEPSALFLPLFSCRFKFGELFVKDGQRVSVGQILARDSANYGLPLLAPRAGTVVLNEVKRHIVIKEISNGTSSSESSVKSDKKGDISGKSGGVSSNTKRLVELGAWQYFSYAHDGSLPDPMLSPRAVIVSTVSFEPYKPRGDILIRNRFTEFIRGLEKLQSFLEYQPIYLVMPKLDSPLARQIREAVRGYAHLKVVQIPRVYPFDNFRLLARKLKLERDDKKPVWALGVQGILALDEVMTNSKPLHKRVITLGGPAASNPAHIELIPGYPIDELLSSVFPDKDSAVVINGGAFTGSRIGIEQQGLDIESSGLTILHRNRERELLGFARPGIDRNSYSRCFLSKLFKPKPEHLSNAMRGERRPCVSCGYCEEVCPARIMPHLLHKLIYQNDLDGVEKARLDLCISCGLCSFVCPSKIDLSKSFKETIEILRKEMQDINK